MLVTETEEQKKIGKLKVKRNASSVVIQTSLVGFLAHETALFTRRGGEI